MTATHLTGHQHAWQTFFSRPAEEVLRFGPARRDQATGRIHLPSFDGDLVIDPVAQTVRGSGDELDFALGTGYFFDLAALWYLATATELSPTGTLITPEQTDGGQIFVQGSHVLPVDRITTRFGTEPNAFTARGVALGGEPLALGDAAVRLYPLPRLPVTLILWQGDDEFPAEARLLFDDTCPRLAATDVLWGVAMVTILLFCRH